MTRIEVVPSSEFIRDRHSGGGEYFLLLLSSCFLQLQLLLLLHPFSASQNLTEASAHIIEFKMGTCDRTGVLLVGIVLRVDSFVVCKIDIVDVIVIVCHTLRLV